MYRPCRCGPPRFLSNVPPSNEYTHQYRCRFCYMKRHGFRPCKRGCDGRVGALWGSGRNSLLLLTIVSTTPIHTRRRQNQWRSGTCKNARINGFGLHRAHSDPSRFRPNRHLGILFPSHPSCNPASISSPQPSHILS